VSGESISVLDVGLVEQDIIATVQNSSVFSGNALKPLKNYRYQAVAGNSSIYLLHLESES